MEKECCHPPLTEELIKDLFTQKKINKTKSKIKLLEEISKSSKPLSVVELHQKMKNECDISTIFRTLSQFKEKGLVQEVNLEEGFYRYEIIHSDTLHHHHHIRCRTCGDIQNLGKCNLSLFERSIAKLGFKDMSHRLEFSGICPKCID